MDRQITRNHHPGGGAGEGQRALIDGGAASVGVRRGQDEGARTGLDQGGDGCRVESGKGGVLAVLDD